MRVLLILAVLGTATPAGAVINQTVKNACQAEYLQYCLGMDVPSSRLRSCFRRNMMQLGQGCLKALVAANEATKADIDRYNAASRGGK